MRKQNHVVAAKQLAHGMAGLPQRFDGINVEPSSCDAAIDDGFDQGNLVDERAARDVDEDRRRSKTGELRLADYVPRLLIQHAMDGDEVACGQHCLEIADLFHTSGLHGGRIDVRIKTHNTRSKPLTDTPRDAPADAADADEANRLAGDILSQPALLRPNPAFAGDRSGDCRESLG